jgi:hypothetical protein
VHHHPALQALFERFPRLEGMDSGVDWVRGGIRALVELSVRGGAAVREPVH